MAVEKPRQNKERIKVNYAAMFRTDLCSAIISLYTCVSLVKGGKPKTLR